MLLFKVCFLKTREEHERGAHEAIYFRPPWWGCNNTKSCNCISDIICSSSTFFFTTTKREEHKRGAMNEATTRTVPGEKFKELPGLQQRCLHTGCLLSGDRVREDRNKALHRRDAHEAIYFRPLLGGLTSSSCWAHGCIQLYCAP